MITDAQALELPQKIVPHQQLIAVELHHESTATGSASFICNGNLHHPDDIRWRRVCHPEMWPFPWRDFSFHLLAPFG